MKYGFIGCGNMGGAIAKALSKSTTDICVADRSGKAKALAAELGIQYADNASIAADCDRIFLAVKPHLMQEVLEPLIPILQQKKPLLISMAAGLEVKKIEAFAGGNISVIRIMPNTPTAIGMGVIQYCSNPLVDADILSDWLADMAPCGLVDPLEERLIDAASALSGSGPAYMFAFLEALVDGAVSCGIPWQKAFDYAAMTMAGAAEMYLQTKQHPAALKNAVCSPGGSTLAGLRALEQHAFRAAAMDCVTATYNKNKELGK